MNAQVEFPFRFRSMPFCRFSVRRRFRFVAFAFNKRLRSVSFVSSRSRFVAFAFRSVAFALRFVAFAFRFVLVLSVVFAQQGSRYSCNASSCASFLQQNGTFRFRVAYVIVCSSCVRPFFADLSSVFLWICSPFFMDLSSIFRGFIVRFSPVFQKFTICTLYVQRSFCAGVCPERKWKRNFLIKGVAFGCTQSGGAPRFRALTRTL